jgi:hypothetical protein
LIEVVSFTGGSIAFPVKVVFAIETGVVRLEEVRKGQGVRALPRLFSATVKRIGETLGMRHQSGTSFSLLGVTFLQG